MSHDARPTVSAVPDSLHTLCRRTGEAREHGRWDEAYALAAQAIRTAPHSADAWSECALALLALRRDGDSLDAARQAVQCDVASPPANRALALALLRHRRVEEAEQAISVALEAFFREHGTSFPEGLATLALLRMMQGRLQEADVLFHQALEAKATMAEAIGNHAALLARLGRDAAALEAATRAAALKPFLPGPHSLRGALLHRAGRFAEAAEAFGAAVSADPATPEHHVSHADSLRLTGQLREAARAAGIGLARHPDHPSLLATLGTALHALGRNDEALAAYERALEKAPELAEVDNNIARLHRDAGRTGPALVHLRRAFAARPTDPDIARSLAALLTDHGPADEALRIARQAADIDPRSSAGLVLLARALARLSRGEEAEAAFATALRLDPAVAGHWFQAGVTLLHAGRRGGAIGAFRQLCRLAPGDARHWALFGQALRGVRFAAADDALRADLAAALAHPAVETGHLVDAVSSVVSLEPALARLCDAAATPDPDGTIRALLERGDLDRLAGDVLLHRLLDSAILNDPALERALTALRRVFLSKAMEANDPVWLPILCALAGQAFLNEHVFAESPAETVAVDTLTRRLETDLAAGTPPDPARLALLSAYRPPHRLAGAATLPAWPWPEPIARLLARQVEGPLAEADLKAGLPRLTPVEDPVSAAVRAQYEDNPYPRWERTGLISAPIPLPAAIRTMFPHVTIPDHPRWEAPDILVAGCGTGREAVWAANHVKGARVLAVDLSLTSLAHAARQSRLLGLDIAYAQADILALGAAFAAQDRRFDLIQCVGVLHHMADPLAGWRGLTGLLRPQGLMKIGLYSERARRPVVAARAFVAERPAGAGYEATTAGIRRFRQDVLALPDDHPAKPVTRSPDFHSVSACRDLVFHVHEHRHSLPQIAGWLAELGLEFLGFQLEDQAVAALYRSRFPEDATLTDLSLWDRFEAEHPHVFGELYQFWVRPKA